MLFRSPRKPDDWGSLRAWAWGPSRAIDYFETDKAIDAKHIAIEGHSRYGKAALVAMAYEPRVRLTAVSWPTKRVNFSTLDFRPTASPVT